MRTTPTNNNALYDQAGLPLLPEHSGGGLRPGVDLDDLSALRELLDGEMRLERLR